MGLTGLTNGQAPRASTSPPSHRPNFERNMPYGTPQMGSWTPPLCDPFGDLTVCFQSFFCDCVMYGDVVNTVRGGGSCGPCCMFCCCRMFMVPGVFPNLRKEMREKFQIPESPSDMTASICYPPWPFCTWSCSLCQMARELKARSINNNNKFEAYGNPMAAPGAVTMGMPPMQMQAVPMQAVPMQAVPMQAQPKM